MIIRINQFSEIEHQRFCSVEPGEWVVVSLTNSAEYRFYTEIGAQGEYSIRISRRNCDWRLAIGDMIGYAENTGCNLVLAVSEQELSQIKEYYNDHSFCERSLRMDEPQILVHSTPLENLEKIQRDGCLKCWNLVSQVDSLSERVPIGHMLGDPKSFRDYVMLGSGVSCELVVASRQKKQIVWDADSEYQSGARLYFDADRLAKDGLLIRDGIHLKVRGRLPLKPYLVWIATWQSIGLSSRIATPRVFAESADREFERRILHAGRIRSGC